MNHQELAFATATETLRALHQGEVTSVQLLEAYLTQVEDHPWVNALVTLDAAAHDEAERADASRRDGARLGPLHGLPVSVKHDVDVQGMPSTYGSLGLRDRVPDRDAEAVGRLRAAGAIVFGRSNLPEWAADGQAYNELHGTTSNPWDRSRTTGGSSGGSAAAVAAGMTGLDLGSDMGGSIRIPASWCGVYGLKPTWGVVPLRGAVPHPADADGAELAAADIVVSGPLARGPEDLDLALTVLATARDDRGGLRPWLPPAPFESVEALRVLVWLDDDAQPVDPGTREVLDHAVDALEAHGARATRDVSPPGGLDVLEELFELLFMADVGGAANDVGFAELDAAFDRLRVESPMAAWHHRALGLSHREWLSMHRRRLRLGEEWRRLFDEYDVVLTPTVPVTALPHDHSEPVWERRFDLNGASMPWRPTLTRWCGAIGVLGLPAVTVPVGLDRSGLPVGMQVVASEYCDRSAIAAARLLGQSVGALPRPTGLGSRPGAR